MADWGTHQAMMALSSPFWLANSEALRLSQQAEQYLQKCAPKEAWTIPTLFSIYPESTETWLVYEKLLLSCLRTGDDKAAHVCLETLVDRFGTSNERVMGLRGLYQEAIAKDTYALERILKEYNEILLEDPVNTVCLPRQNCASRTNARSLP